MKKTIIFLLACVLLTTSFGAYVYSNRSDLMAEVQDLRTEIKIHSASKNTRSILRHLPSIHALPKMEIKQPIKCRVN